MRIFINKRNKLEYYENDKEIAGILMMLTFLVALLRGE
jgi:hypothetical protein